MEDALALLWIAFLIDGINVKYIYRSALHNILLTAQAVFLAITDKSLKRKTNTCKQSDVMRATISAIF